jgi:hypothetical protein
MIERIIQRVRVARIPVTIWLAVSLMILGITIIIALLAQDACFQSQGRCADTLFAWYGYGG